MQARGISPVQIAKLRGVPYSSSQFSFAPSRALIKQYAEVLDDGELLSAATDDRFWDRIVSIERAGEENVFDLTVPGPASWIANFSCISHNSGAIEQDADLILFIYREEVYERDTPRKGIADIIIAKQRNGPVGDFRLTFLGQFTRFENLVAEAYGEGVF